MSSFKVREGESVRVHCWSCGQVAEVFREWNRQPRFAVPERCEATFVQGCPFCLSDRISTGNTDPPDELLGDLKAECEAQTLRIRIRLRK